MCDLITFAIPGRFTPPSVSRAHGARFGVARFVNAGGGHRYPPGLQAYSLTAGGCSCGLFTPAPVAAARAKRAAALEARYRSRGWSQAKVARALQDHQASEARNERLPGFTAYVLSYFASVLAVSPLLHFIVHYHNGHFTEEPFVLLEPTSLTESQLQSGTPLPEYDRLYTVRRVVAG